MTISATVVGNALVTTGIAFFNVATQCGSAALLNGAHDTTLPPAQ
jgi:hypothetical protein